jgi:hypothetical protein
VALWKISLKTIGKRHMPTRIEYIQHIQALAAAERAAAPSPDWIYKEIGMADDPKKTGLDRKLIAMNEPHEVRSWTEALGVTKEQLAAAVKAVGNSAEAVRAYLKKH